MPRLVPAFFLCSFALQLFARADALARSANRGGHAAPPGLGGQFAPAARAGADGIRLRAGDGAGPAPAWNGISRNLSDAPGSTVVFSVAATGDSPITYQWRKDGVPVTNGLGSSATFSVSDLEDADAATYDVVLINSFGAAVSPGITLTLRPAYTLTTLAGVKGEMGAADGVGDAARFIDPVGLVIDPAGNLYVTDDNRIRKIQPDGTVTTLAGVTNMTDGTDGTGTEAHFRGPRGLAIDGAGNLYVADTGNDTIRKITPAAVVTTLAGTSDAAGSSDGTGAMARFAGPRGLAVDSAGNVYVADTDNHTIRKITPAGAVTTIAGSAGVSGYVDGPGSAARFYQPQALALSPQETTLYVADLGNHRIRTIQLSAESAAFDVSTFVGSGDNGSIDGTGTSVSLSPFGLATDAAGNIYATEFFRLRKISPDGVVSTLAGRFDPLNYPNGIAVDSAGKLYLADENNRMIRIAAPPDVPAISLQPDPAPVAAGSAWSIHADVTGSGPFAYQWRKNGVAIAGATASTLSLSTVAPADAGYYTIAVTNAGGTFTSDAVPLTIEGALSVLLAPVGRDVSAGDNVTFKAAIGGSPAPAYQWQLSTDGGDHWTDLADDADTAGATTPILTVRHVAVVMNDYRYRCLASNSLASLATPDAALVVEGPPAFRVPPQSQSVVAGASTSLNATAVASTPVSLQWTRNGVDIAGATSAALPLAAVQPSDTGIYSVVATNGGRSTTSEAAIVGVSTTAKVIADGRELQADILHPNGNVFDQVLVTGPAESVTADYELGQVTRTSFIDLDDDIVQVEFSGPGTLSLVLDEATSPAPPVNYNQSSVSYVKGHAGIVITGADEHTNLSVFTVGRATAFDPTGRYDILAAPGPGNDPATNGSPLFVGHEATVYDGVADLAFIAILSTNGKFGGLRTSNVNYFASHGLTGIYAPGIAFAGPVFIGNITAFDDALPAIILGSAADVRITGGNMEQANSPAPLPVQVSGITALKFTDGSDSGGNLLPAQQNRATYRENGVDVTSQIVVGP